MNQAKRVALLIEGLPEVEKMILEAFAQEDFVCSVVVTRDGVEGLDYLVGRGAYAGRDTHAAMPCVTLLDLSLPDSDGLEVLREIRAHEKTRLLPVVAFSSSNVAQEVDAVYAAGANSYIGKSPGFRSFDESLRGVARYWCVLNEPPPAL